MKFVIPAIGSALIFTRFRKSPHLASAMHLPSASAAIGWTCLYLSWMLTTDILVGWRGPWNFQAWRTAPIAASALRVLAVVFAGPLLEEIVFRGLVFAALARSKLKPLGAVIATAAVWSILHWSYEPVVVVIIFVAGVILGLARWRTGSLYLPIAMHMIWNAYAIW